MSYFDRYTPEYHDHQRDLAKHSWPRAEVSSQPDPAVPGVTAHVITAFTEQEVRAEINRLLFPSDAPPCAGQFTTPKHVRGRWHATGWTQKGVLS